MTQLAEDRFRLIETGAESELPSFGDEVRAGLAERPRSLPCRFFYDEAGSEIFEEICELPEYYVTRAERAILEARADEIAALWSGPITLAELGSGSSSKTRVLIEALLRAHGGLRYLPVDISRTMLETSALELLDCYEALKIRAIASEYEEGLRHVRAETGRPKLIAWLGGTIGNLHRGEATKFLAGVRRAMAHGDRLLVGIDLRKDAEVLERAYDDEAGVTARFNLNLLDRINRELGGDFDLGGFRHRARYQVAPGRVQMHLVSQRDQRVRIEELGLELHFAAGEEIHTEDSYKYGPEEIEKLAAQAGLAPVRQWSDPDGLFTLNLLRPAG